MKPTLVESAVIVARYREGAGIFPLADEFHVGPPRIRRMLREAGVPMRRRGAQPGNRNVRWAGGRVRHDKGYVMVRMPDHPRAHRNGYVFEHIIVAERMIGRSLRADELVHHRNEIRSDNRDDNLQVMTIGEHQRHHLGKPVPVDKSTSYAR